MSVIALDLDGTLLDCRERQSLLAASLCRAAGFELNLEDFWNAKREGLTTESAICKQGVGGRLATKLSGLWVEQIESDVWLRMDRLLAGVLRSLHNARKLGFQLHMITARANEPALGRQLRWLSLETLFDRVQVVYPREASQQKETYLSAVEPLVFIGDTESDAAAAKAAKVRFLAVTSGQRSSEYLQANAHLGAQEIKPNLHEALQDFLYATL